MAVRSGGVVLRVVAAGAVAGSLLLAACGSPASPRPTDPRAILSQAATGTAALPSVRLHLELQVQMAGFGGGAAMRFSTTVDADVDLATRQLAGRSTSQAPNLADPAATPQVTEVIITQAATFSRNPDTGRWIKIPSNGFAVGATNAQIAAMVVNLISDPAVSLELAEAGPCTLGTCDHVLARLDGPAFAKAMGPLLGMPPEAEAQLPNIDLDLLVDQATSVLSEARTALSMDGSTVRLWIALSNPGAPVQVVPPPAGLIDDLNLGGFGPPQPVPAETAAPELSGAP